MNNEKTETPENWRHRLHEIIFESDTYAGRLFDIVLLLAIVLSVIAVMLESVPIIEASYGTVLRVAEWVFTILFTIEYLVRIVTLKRPKYYIFSFYGLIDLLSVLPTYLSLLFSGTQALIVIRIFRLLRVFRILKLIRFLGEANILIRALKDSLPKIIVFLVAIVCIATIMGTTMYLVEGPEHGFKSIPMSVYWAVVTLTTVGYGDISPQTPLGQSIATILMVMGYGIIAVPTGIVTAHLTRRNLEAVDSPACPGCGNEHHDIDARFCKKCGASLSG